MTDAAHVERLRQATDATARVLQQTPGKIVEKTLERTFNSALGLLSGRPCTQARIVLPNWHPQPGSFDSALGNPQAPEMVGEMKWSSQNKVFEVLWDAIKLCAALEGPAQTAFLAYGFPTRLWNKPVECAQLFSRRRSGGRRVIAEDSLWVQGILRCAARGVAGGDRS